MINEHKIRNKFIIKKKLLVYISNMNNQTIKKTLMTEILGQEISSFIRWTSAFVSKMIIIFSSQSVLNAF